MDLIAKCSVERLPGFLHACIDEQLLGSPADYSKYQSIWNLEEWMAVKSTTKKTFMEAVKQQQSADEFLTVLQDVPEMHKNAFIDALEIRQNDLRVKCIYDTNNIGTNALTNFDWEVKLSLASDKISSMYEPLLGLNLDIQECSGNKAKFSLELNKIELDQVLASLESIHKALMKLKD